MFACVCVGSCVHVYACMCECVCVSVFTECLRKPVSCCLGLIPSWLCVENESVGVDGPLRAPELRSCSVHSWRDVRVLVASMCT